MPSSRRYAIRRSVDVGAQVVAAELAPPWSVLKISDLPHRASASFRATTQNSASIVFDSRQASTFRLAQSMIATR